MGLKKKKSICKWNAVVTGSDCACKSSCQTPAELLFWAGPEMTVSKLLLGWLEAQKIG